VSSEAGRRWGVVERNAIKINKNNVLCDGDESLGWIPGRLAGLEPAGRR
jgi:hypothetical protein